MDDTGGYDAFLSYRRKDGLALASWLRSQLLGFRLSAGLHAADSGRVIDASERLRIFLDVAYQKASVDFFDAWIKPNLARARHLVIVVTPSLKDALPDGKRHWVDLELDVARHLIARMRPFGPIPSLNLRIRHPRGSQIKCN